MLEVALDALRLSLNATQASGDSAHELQLSSRWRLLRDGLLQIGVSHLVGVEFRAVAGQVEHLDLVHVLGQPSLDRLAVMHLQVVQNQVHLAPRVLDESLQEVDQDDGVGTPVLAMGYDAAGCIASYSQLSARPLTPGNPNSAMTSELITWNAGYDANGT